METSPIFRKTPKIMFRKQSFVIKSSTHIRHSERKALFPAHINSCFNSKQQFSQLKVGFPNGVTHRVFVHDKENKEKEPMLFQRPEEANVFYPSLYFLWAFPDKTAAFFPILHIHVTTFGFLQKGSDLMIPGIYMDSSYPEFGISPEPGLFMDCKFPEFDESAPVSIATLEEDENGKLVCFGPVAVGKALMSSAEMKERRRGGQKGKAVEILHIFGDSLWSFGSKKEIPRLEMPAETRTAKMPDENSWASDEEKGSGTPVDEGKQLAGTSAEALGEPSSSKMGEEQNVQAEMDEMLEQTFFSALRWILAPEIEADVDHKLLPIDVGQFYANYILKCLPPGKRLDIKKTRFKKFSTFLREVNKKGGTNPIFSLKTVKGIDSIENVNFDHPLVHNACQPDLEEEDEAKPATSTGTFLKVNEQMYSLTEHVMVLFKPKGFHKGDLVDLNVIRSVFMDYANKQNLVKDGGKCVELDDQLQTIFKCFLPHAFPVNTLVQKLAAAMTKTVLVKTKDGQQVVHRGKVPSVEIKVEKRAGNKVVTLVNNLTAFGIDVKAVDKEIKGTGTSIQQTAPACEGPQLMIQGNEVNKVGRILDTLGLPKKFIKGLELGIKEKKPKKR